MATLTTYPTAAGDANETEWSKLCSPVIDDGVIRGVDGEAAVFADSTGMQVKIPAFRAVIQGFFCENASQETLTGFGAPHATNPRIDRVVVRLNLTSPVSSSTMIIPGTAAASPSAPSIGSNDLMLAQVRIEPVPNATIAANKVTDERVFAVANGDGGLGRMVLRGALNAILFEDQAGADKFLVGLRSDMGSTDDFFSYSYGGNFYWRSGSGGQAVKAKLDMTAASLTVGTNAGGGSGTGVAIGSFGASEAYVKAVRDTTNCAIVIQSKGTATSTSSAVIFADGSSNTSAYFTSPSGINSLDTTLVIGRQLSSTFTLQRVTQGAVDSGGSGFRVLCVPN